MSVELCVIKAQTEFEGMIEKPQENMMIELG